MPLMTPAHPRWQEFLTRLTGPEGCFFRRVEDTVVWDCLHGRDKRKAQALLYQFDAVDVPTSLAWFENQGAACDCAILFRLSPQAQGLMAQRQADEQEANRLARLQAKRTAARARKRRTNRLKRRKLPDPLKHQRLKDIRMLLGVTQQQFAILLEEKNQTAWRKISLMEHRLRPVPDSMMERAEALHTRYTRDPTVVESARRARPHHTLGRPRNPEGVPSHIRKDARDE